MRPIDPCHRRDRRATTAAILFLACGGAAILFFSDNDRLQTLQSRSLAENPFASAVNGRHLKNKGHTIVATVQEISMPTPSPTPEVAKRLPGPYLKLRYTGGRIGNDLFSLASGLWHSSEIWLQFLHKYSFTGCN